MWGAVDVPERWTIVFNIAYGIYAAAHWGMTPPPAPHGQQ